ncbi:MAG: anti-sigma factor antagonist [Clostridia bacterium]|nr:anti-sigma factor antagonist [Clostridia bacterium]
MSRFTCSQDRLVVYLEGEIDHHAARYLRTQIEEMIQRTKAAHLILDFSGVGFIDSSGIGMIIGRYKTMRSRQGKMSARGLNAAADRLFHMAGLHRIIPIEAAKEETKEEMKA